MFNISVLVHLPLHLYLQDFGPKHRIADAPFTFETSLGDGALGDVYRDVYKGTPVAVKVFR